MTTNTVTLLGDVNTSINAAATDTTTQLDNVKTSIDMVVSNTAKNGRCVRSQLLSLNSTNRDASSSENAPVFTLPATISCGIDEYIELSLMRLSFYHDMVDIPDSSISITQGGTTRTVSVAAGKHLLGSLATLIQNAYIAYDSAFRVSYSSGRGAYTFSFGSAATMSVLTPDLQRYLGLPSGPLQTNVGNQILSTLPVRPQKWLYVNVVVSNLTAATPSFAYNAATNTIASHTVLASIPILSSPFILANWRQYAQNEMAMRVTNTSISAIHLQYLDTVSGQPIPLRENDACIQVSVFKK